MHFQREWWCVCAVSFTRILAYIILADSTIRRTWSNYNRAHHTHTEQNDKSNTSARLNLMFYARNVSMAFLNWSGMHDALYTCTVCVESYLLSRSIYSSWANCGWSPQPLLNPHSYTHIHFMPSIYIYIYVYDGNDNSIFFRFILRCSPRQKWRLNSIHPNPQHPYIIRRRRRECARMAFTRVLRAGLIFDLFETEVKVGVAGCGVVVGNPEISRWKILSLYIPSATRELYFEYIYTYSGFFVFARCT